MMASMTITAKIQKAELEINIVATKRFSITSASSIESLIYHNKRLASKHMTIKINTYTFHT